MNLSPRVSRLLALALPILAVWLGWSLWLAPLLGQINDDREAIARSETLLARYDALAGETPALEARLATLRSRAQAGGFVAGNSAVLAAATLQSSVQGLTNAAGVQLRSSQTMPAETDEGFTRVGLELDLSVTPETLAHLLYGIESASPSLFIDTLAVHSPENATAPGAVMPDLPLTVRIKLHAYLQTASR